MPRGCVSTNQTFTTSELIYVSKHLHAPTQMQPSPSLIPRNKKEKKERKKTKENTEGNPWLCQLSGPKRSVKITDRFTCTSANVIYCITCTLCKTLYIGETGRRLGDRFREHLRDVEKDDKDASKPVARHFNLPNHSKEHMSICGLSLHQGTTDSRKNLEQRFIFQIGTLNPHGINERFSFN